MDTLLTWLRISQLETTEPEPVLELVQAALDEVDEEHPAYAWLVSLEVDLEDGKLPLSRLERFRERFSEAPKTLDDCAELEARYRRLAEDLTAAEWRTRRLERVFRWLEGEPEDLEAIREAIFTAWEQYQGVSLTADEITAETVVGHRLLLDGLERWLEALDGLATAGTAAEEQEALGKAIYANRLLVAVQRLHQEVAAAS